jgi:predicted N-acetyltransferase YhbS
VRILNSRQLEILFPVRPLFLQRRRTVTDFDPSRKTIGTSPRVAHVAQIFAPGDGTPSQRFVVDGAKQRGFPSGTNSRSYQIPHCAFILSMGTQAVTVRTAKPEDAPICGQICYSAFSTINQSKGFAPDFPGPEATTGMLSTMFSHPGFYCVVAEAGGRIVGSNCLDERSIIAGVGPITIDPERQNRGAGRKLMQAVLDRARERGAPGVRLVQAAFHNRSLSLYASLGFEIREPLSCMQGRTKQRLVPGCTVRPARPEDVDRCGVIARRVHGFDRSRELAEAVQQGTGMVVERENRITGCASALAFFGHATAETNLDLQALIASADSFGGPGILVPSRNSALFQWCLANGLRVVQPMTLMSMGLYNGPAGAWFPSITF